MPKIAFSVEILLGVDGVRLVRVLGNNWDQSAEAHALLHRLSPLIQRLDAEAKRHNGADIRDDEGIQ